MIGFNGGLIGKDRTATALAAAGVWTLGEQIKAKRSLEWPVVGGDLDYASVTLLLHLNGTNGSTTITDNSTPPKTITAQGNAQISTAQSKAGFGGASLLLDGSGDYLSGTDSGFAFGTGDFAVELMAYPTTTGGYKSLIATRDGAGGYTDRWTLGVGPNMEAFIYTDGFKVITSNSVLPVNTWTNIAVTRSGTDLRIFINGTQSGSTGTNSQNFTHTALGVGASSSGLEAFTGYIDEVRITKGVPRYISNYTAQLTQFQDA